LVRPVARRHRTRRIARARRGLHSASPARNTDDQQETDHYWNAIVGNGGQESACGWCKDKWGVSWQITPRTLTEALAAGGNEAKRAFEAMMDMKKIDVDAIEAARRRADGPG
jgi:predicted 3-demethylubiquinone-9 3-methyltransferase (glyoxalase superfamily)